MMNYTKLNFKVFQYSIKTYWNSCCSSYALWLLHCFIQLACYQVKI